MTPKQLEQRLFLLTVAAVLVFTVLVGRLGYLQLVEGEKYEKLATENRIRLLPLAAPRGDFLDRNGNPLVTSRLAPVISVVPMDMKKPDEVLQRLSQLLGYDVRQTVEDTIARLKERKEYRPYTPIRIATDADIATLTKIAEHQLELPGVMIEEQPIRDYPLKDVGAHVFGYVREISKEELDAWRDKGYKMGDIVGKTGLERVYDEVLRGEPGGQQVEVDAGGRPVKTLPGRKVPVAGSSLKLTLDRSLEEAAAQGLRESMDRIKTQFPTKAGAVVVLDVRTGAVLAMVSEPSFDPNDFTRETIPPDTWQAMNDPKWQPQLNRAIRGEYPPGSTFKMVVATAGLETGTIRPQDTIVDRGVYWRIEPKKCWKPGGHGVINLTRAIEVSCNVYFYDLGYRTGIDAINRYAEGYGLGRPTGINLYPGEKTGLLATPEWKLKNYKLLGLKKPEPWQPGETLSAAIGQGFSSFTPLQMANYIATLANGGTRYRPYLVSQVIGPDGKVKETYGPEVMAKMDLKPSTLAAIKEGMHLVAQGPEGTAAAYFRNFPIPVAGKTGTAQNPHGADHGWFVGFAPYDKPEIAVAVLVEQGGHGGSAAAPVARRIFETYFHVAPARQNAPATPSVD
ncbi:penicillin-binding protein 2 [Gelria sp. Kuro-4]|uniref:penicillin-binding protein 2 n=1 Tax=Gelria sp. Kuro-4 TaxID=2796927 RepID=UPI001BEEA35A|nr:penicillin-binding protein 2 [Gelria sp. Kuro-4]BCV25781.1 penicillin-binding protein 2 [Gelria sp. Kuro-4]